MQNTEAPTMDALSPLAASREEPPSPANAPSRSRLDRALWTTLTLTCALAGCFLGWRLGLIYSEWRAPGGVLVQGVMRGIVGATFVMGFAVLMARVGSWLADRSLAALARVNQLSVVDRVLGIVGALIGLTFGALISLTLSISGLGVWIAFVKLFILMLSAAVGIEILSGMRGEILRVFPMLDENASSQVLAAGATPKIIDTNIIIDGRIADLCRSGFIEGMIYVPNFVLSELQHIADSPDSMRRARGRRGLETLNAMREITIDQALPSRNGAEGLTAKIPIVQVLSDISPDVARIETVDFKLVALAKELKAAVVTNDFNLNRVAELQGVRVLNLNALALAMRPVVLPGEELVLTIVREGKDAGQGIGYLEDGTMVVVGDGASHVNATCRVTISQVIQTVAGKMIFAEMRGPRGPGDDLFDEANTGSGTARVPAYRSENDDNDNRTGGGTRRKNRS